MIDELIFKKGIHEPKTNFLLFGFIIAMIGIGTSLLIFGLRSSGAQIMMTTLLLIPIFYKIFNLEEKIARKEGFKHIYRNHKDVFQIFIILFIGVFLAFLLVQLISLNYPGAFGKMFSFQVDIIEKNEDLIYGQLGLMPAEGINNIFKIFLNMTFFIVLCFVLSFLYGTGGIFFGVAASSVFASIIVMTIKSIDVFFEISLLFALFFAALLIPIMLSSIAGAIISKAYISKVHREKYFKNVLKEGTVLFVISIVLALIIVIITGFVSSFF